MTVCNACRYCEQYCPVFKAMEQRLTFASADLNYLANLCHNCGECLYACQYAPPHEFAINVPQTLAQVRVRSYEQYAWPAPLGVAFRHHGVAVILLFAAALIAAMLAAVWASNGTALTQPGASADFYAVMPHWIMAGLFGSVGLFVVLALSIGVVRFRRDIEPVPKANAGLGGALRALRAVLSLRHLRASGQDCVTSEDFRTPWRRRFHHATFYGFALCFASTAVATVYHAFGWQAPYPYASAPVLLGALGGVGLLVGPVGLLLQRRHRDAALSDSVSERLDRSFLVLLLLTSATGLLLLALRHHAAMGVLLVVHLGIVLALFLTLPYGKFVHGLYRAAALLKHAREEGRHSIGGLD